jgi:hypothetical protein
MFQKLDLFPSPGEGWQTPTLLDQLERANLSHRAQNSSNPECYTPSSEPFRIQLFTYLKSLMVTEE